MSKLIIPRETAAAIGIPVRGTITRVKVFSQSGSTTLTSAINNWLEEQGPGFRLKDIKYSHTDGKSGGGGVFSALAIYTDLEPLEDDEEEVAE